MVAATDGVVAQMARQRASGLVRAVAMLARKHEEQRAAFEGVENKIARDCRPSAGWRAGEKRRGRPRISSDAEPGEGLDYMHTRGWTGQPMGLTNLW